MQNHHRMIPGLTEDQQQKINKLNIDFEKNTLQSHNQIREKEAQLKTLLTQDKINLDQADKFIDEIGTLKSAIRKEKVRTDMKIRELLTDDQKVIFDLNRSHGFGRNAGNN